LITKMTTIYADTGDTELSANTNYKVGTLPNYPDYTTETIFGTVLLPKIYGQNLDQFEIAADGKIVLTVQGLESMYINTDQSKLSIEASNQSLQFIPNDASKTVQVGDHTWTRSNNYQVLSTDRTSGYLTENDFTFNGSSVFNGTATFHGSTLGINAEESVAITSSNVHIDGTLEVTKTVTFNSNLSVTDATTLSSTLSVLGTTTLASSLSVADATTLNNILSVNGATTLNNILSVGGVTTLDSNLSVADATTLSSTLDVADATSLASTLSVFGTTTLASNLSVADATTLNNILSVNGATTLNNILSVNGATTLSNILSVGGVTTLNNTLSVSGVTTLNNTLSVSGTTTLLSSLSVGGDLTVRGDLDIVGAINSIEQYQTVLNIEDNIITLNSSNSAQAVNNTGLIIGGEDPTFNLFDTQLPDTTVRSNLWNKSLTWNLNGGYQELGIYQDQADPGKVVSEPYWEMLGAPLHLSQNVWDGSSGINKISFVFRMNADEELEIVKLIEKDGVKTHSRLARFGTTSPTMAAKPP
jgi:hypothetical protein